MLSNLPLLLHLLQPAGQAGATPAKSWWTPPRLILKPRVLSDIMAVYPN